MKKHILILLAVGTIVIAGCAKARSEGGTDGVTHWLAECESSAECGELECLCGMCTAACEDSAGCAMLGASAACMPPTEASCSGPAQICQRPTMSMPAEDSGAAGAAGAVVPGAGGSGPRDSGPIAADEPAVCKRMDARSAGTLCGGIAGYAWDGLKCREILCTCTGSDCGEIYATVSDCESATRDCEHLASCDDRSECVLESAECCQCSPVFDEDVHAVSASHVATHTVRVCGGLDCEACAVDPLVNARKRFVPTCELDTRREGSVCAALDLSRMSCTQESGCRVRVARCCECGPDPSVEDLFAAPVGGNVAELFCEPDHGCCEAEPNYPENVTARCGSAGFCELLLDGRVILPGNP
jgi:hypothetical protein